MYHFLIQVWEQTYILVSLANTDRPLLRRVSFANHTQPWHFHHSLIMGYCVDMETIPFQLPSSYRGCNVVFKLCMILIVNIPARNTLMQETSRGIQLAICCSAQTSWHIALPISTLITPLAFLGDANRAS